MRLESILFDNAKEEQRERYERMAAVLKLSAFLNSPMTPLTLHNIYDDDADIKVFARRVCKDTWIDNARKTKHHARIVRDAADGEVIGLLDSDMFVLQDLSSIEDLEFDLAITMRNPTPTGWLLNTGVYFVRVSERIRKFMKQWFTEALWMLQDEAHHNNWRIDKRYGGLNQAALGSLLCGEAGQAIRVTKLPCAIWNSVDDNWGFDAAKIVHLMGPLREWIFGVGQGNSEGERAIVRCWKTYAATADKLER